MRTPEEILTELVQDLECSEPNCVIYREKDRAKAVLTALEQQ
jgi:hypothetical protein